MSNNVNIILNELMSSFNEEEKYILSSKGSLDFKNLCFKFDKNKEFHFVSQKEINDIDEKILKELKEENRKATEAYLLESLKYREKNEDKFDLIESISCAQENYDKFYKREEENENIIDLSYLNGKDCFVSYKIFEQVKKHKFDLYKSKKKIIKPEFKAEYQNFLSELKNDLKYKSKEEIEKLAIERTNKTKIVDSFRISNKKITDTEEIPLALVKYIEHYR